MRNCDTCEILRRRNEKLAIVARAAARYLADDSESDDAFAIDDFGNIVRKTEYDLAEALVDAGIYRKDVP